MSSLSVIQIHKHKEIGYFCLCWKERQTKFVTVNRYIPYVFMKAKVSTVILIYSASVILLLPVGAVDLEMYTFIVYLYIYIE